MSERSPTPLVIGAVFGLGAGIGLAIWGCWLGYGAIKDAGYEECQRAEVRELKAQLEAEQGALTLLAYPIVRANPDVRTSMFSRGGVTVINGTSLRIATQTGGAYILVPVRDETDAVTGYTVIKE